MLSISGTGVRELWLRRGISVVVNKVSTRRNVLKTVN